LHWAGRYSAVVAATTPLARDASAYTPLHARALLVKGDAEQRLLAVDDAARDLHEASALALEARDDATAADAWVLLVRVDGWLRARPHEGERWGRYAEAALKRLGGDDER